MNFMRLSCVLSLVMCVGLQGAILNQEKLGRLMRAIDVSDSEYAVYIVQEDWKGMPKEEVAALLNSQVPLPNDSKHKMTPLHYAAWCMDFKVVEALLQAGALVNSAQSFDHYTPGMVAALRYSTDKVAQVDKMLNLLAQYDMDRESKAFHGQFSVDDMVRAALESRQTKALRKQEQFADAEGDSWSYSTAESADASPHDSTYGGESVAYCPGRDCAQRDAGSESLDEGDMSPLAFAMRDIREVAQCYELYSDELDPSSMEGLLARWIRDKERATLIMAGHSEHVRRLAPIRRVERTIFRERYPGDTLDIGSHRTAAATIAVLGQKDAQERKNRK